MSQGWADVSKPESMATHGGRGGGGSGRRGGGARAIASNIGLGQLISLFISGSGIAAASLSDRGMNFPLFMGFVVYVALCAYMVRVRPPFRLPLWKYAVYALLDVQANFLVVLSFRFTSITSVMLLDCFSIPVAMVMSYLFLDARYTHTHLLGVLLCLIGLALTVINDLEDKEHMAGHSIKGDMMCLAGAFLYGCLNVMQEGIVKKHDRSEFLGLLGMFGMLFCGVQFLALEAAPMRHVQFSWAGIAFVVLYVSSIFGMYAGTSVFLQGGDAALFNLGLLTSDMYGMVFAYFVEKQRFDALYIVAFLVIISGLFVYHNAPSATSPTLQHRPSPRTGLPTTHGAASGTAFISLDENALSSPTSAALVAAASPLPSPVVAHAVSPKQQSKSRVGFIQEEPLHDTPQSQQSGDTRQQRRTARV